jgi:uncharacterized membrane protein YjjP (DUF1212 family)
MAAVEFLLRFAEAGHAAGYTTAELEDRLTSLAHALGEPEIQVSATPTMIDLGLGPLRSQRTYTLRVQPAVVDLGAIARLDRVVQQVLDEGLDGDQALVLLDRALSRPRGRPWPVLLGAYALAAAALVEVLGGHWRDAIAAAIVGLVVGCVSLPAQRIERADAIRAPVAAIFASFAAIVVAHTGLHSAPDLVTLAALVTFLPGMTLTVGMRELATQHLQSGVANVATALVQLLGLVFGVEIGRSIAISWFGAAASVTPHTPFGLTQILAAIAAGLAFTVTLRAQSRDAIAMCCATVLALTANHVGEVLLGKQAGVFGAALAVGVAGELVGAYRRRSPLVFIVPGVFMLVPGSAGFNSALQLLSNQTVTGITTAFDTFVTAISIAYGLMIATLVLPRRFTQIVARRSTLRDVEHVGRRGRAADAGDADHAAARVAGDGRD